MKQTFGEVKPDFGGGNPDWDKYFDFLDTDKTG